jgi:hypothetical protein
MASYEIMKHEKNKKNTKLPNNSIEIVQEF